MKKHTLLGVLVVAVILALALVARHWMPTDAPANGGSVGSVTDKDTNKNDVPPGNTDTGRAPAEFLDLPEVTVPVLMFHDVKTVAGGTWSMSADNFRDTLEFLLDNGYTPVSVCQLIDYVDGAAGIPEKPVVITLDDGYFSNYRNVLPIITELEVPVTVFMVCETVRDAGTVPAADENILYKMSAAELAVMQSSPYVEIQSHSYAMHGMNTAYSVVEREGVRPIATEDESTYKEVFSTDCAAAEAVLESIGAKAVAFSYPNGKYHEWSEEVLRERGYRLSFNSEEGVRNVVVRGEPETLFMLGRVNINDETTREQLLRCLER